MPPKKKLVGEEDNLLWTNNEIEILLGTVRGFKAEKEHEVINWESIKDKYERIRYKFFLMARKGRNTHTELQFLHENVLFPK